jgi:hypothetical protein
MPVRRVATKDLRLWFWFGYWLEGFNQSHGAFELRRAEARFDQTRRV